MKIFIGGDVVPTDVNELLFEQGDSKALFNGLTEITKNADAYIVNLECCLTDGGYPIRKKGPNIKASTKSVNGLVASKITHVALANNHSVDLGVDATKEMLDVLKANNIGYVGVGDNAELARDILYIEKDGVKVGIVNSCEHEYTYAKENSFGANGYSPLKTVEDIKKAKQNADYVIVIFHGGKEYCRYPSPRLMDTCRLFTVSGANAVLCQHTHCISCYEEYAGGHILYGQGNYNFIWQNFPRDCWNTGLLAEFDIDKNSFKVNYIPTYIKGVGIDVASGDIKDEILNGLAKRNEELANGKWIDGWRDFCFNDVKNAYVEAVTNSFKDGATDDDIEMFSHFIDCEAHLDVLQELYKSWHKAN